MLLLYTSAPQTGFYFTPFASTAHTPLLNSHLPPFGKSLRVFDKDRLTGM